MKITLQQTEKLLTGNQKFKVFAFSMLLTHLKERYARAPIQLTLQSCAAEINAFLVKYHSIMTKDYEIIESL